MEADDLRYIWVAYKTGQLAKHDPLFEQEMDPQEFREVFAEYVSEGYGGAWMFFAEMNGEWKPAGFAIGWVRMNIIQMGTMVWFPWVTNQGYRGYRIILEASVNFFNEMRKNFLVMEFAQMKDKRFFEHIAKHGIMRRVGHVHDLYPNGPAVLFQTRK